MFLHVHPTNKLNLFIYWRRYSALMSVYNVVYCDFVVFQLWRSLKYIPASCIPCPDVRVDVQNRQCDFVVYIFYISFCILTFLLMCNPQYIYFFTCEKTYQSNYSLKYFHKSIPTKKFFVTLPWTHEITIFLQNTANK